MKAWKLVPVALALTVLASACGKSRNTATRPPSITTTSPTTAGPTTTLTTPPTSTDTPTPSIDVRVYFLHGDVIDVAHRHVPPTSRVATAAVAELLSGPTAADKAAGLATAVPVGTRLLGITISGGTATVDLSGAFASGGGSLSTMARLAQVTFTLTQFPTVERVALRLDGRPVKVFGGEGIVIDRTLTRASFPHLLPPILVEAPGRDSTVTSPIHIAGSANVFEGQFNVELTGPDGKVVAARTIQATSGSGTRGTFDVKLSFPASVGGRAILTVFDVSMKDGSRTDAVTIPLELEGS